MKIILIAILFTCLAFVNSAHSGESVYHRNFSWQQTESFEIAGTTQHLLQFDGSWQHEPALLPAFRETFFFDTPNTQLVGVSLKNQVFDDEDVSRYLNSDQLFHLGVDVRLQATEVGVARRQGVNVSFVPLVIEPLSGKVLRLVAADIVIESLQVDASLKFTPDYAPNSVLASGNWFKFAVSETGVFKITHADLVAAGLNPATIDPRNLRLFGNAGGMLPEPNQFFRHDDLVENAIVVVGEDDGVFNQQDYILFFGQSPHEWKYAPGSKVFEQIHNIYDNNNYYFLTADLGRGKRVAVQPNTTKPVTNVVNRFDDFQVHELEQTNLIKSGREWYGELFEAVLTRNYTFEFPNRVTDSTVSLRLAVAARSYQASSFNFNFSGTTASLIVPQVEQHAYAAFARRATINRTIQTNDPKIDVRITYNRNSPPSSGWLDYIQVYAIRELIMTGDVMTFRNLHTIGPDRASEFRLRNANQNLKIWDVTDAANAKEQQTQLLGSELIYTLATDHLREFVAFDPAKAKNATFIEKVNNQNLHGQPVPDYLIVTHPLFLVQAERLADFHRSFSGLDVLVVTTGQIYNEFSSGKQDVAAIRDLARMFYVRSTDQKQFRYLLLFGDASFDYKDRTLNNTNFVPVWSSRESLDETYSYVTDDFFGLLDENEGGDSQGILDIGVGRLPVSAEREAEEMVDKIIHYASKTHITMEDWRNVICFVADDEDNNLHIRQAENLANQIKDSYEAFNKAKIYMDAYPQVSVPGGTRYPEVNADINRRVQQGALIVNYTGHGGILGWAEERVLELSDIRGWTNFDRMPVFITATCEFAYFDNPAIVSAGEQVLLNPRGGAIALFTTTRPTYASPNYNLNRKIFDYAFEPINGQNASLGDIMRLAKQDGGNTMNARKFVLLGDPALQLAIPRYNVKTTHVNGHDITQVTDTIRALSMVNIKGIVTDLNNNLMEDFNGVLTPAVFDKVQKITTRANDGGETFVFTSQQNILYKGNVSIENGRFEFDFLVPKDIAYAYDAGKISYYATDGVRDANGFDTRLIIGGFDDDVVADNSGPEIALFINDDNFEFGGLTDENPWLFARVSDESGINTTGIGIGHDITAVLNNETDKPHVLNEFYRSDRDTFKSGTILYPFFNLPAGRHSLVLKVWDVHNNSAEASIEFVVVRSAEIALEEVLNFPNPFIDNTTFLIEHNQAGRRLDVEIRVYSLDGRLRKTLREEFTPSGYRTPSISWDGRDDNGNPLAGGIYVYRVLINNRDTGATAKGNKLVIVRP